MTDEEAVSPVIGVILMVAITVILAAVIGTFVLGIGQDQQDTPQASFDFTYNGSSQVMTVSHEGGDSFTSGNSASLTVRWTDSSGTQDDSDWTLSVGAGDRFNASNTMSADLMTSSAVDSGDEFEVVWTSPTGTETQILADFTIV